MGSVLGVFEDFVDVFFDIVLGGLEDLLRAELNDGVHLLETWGAVLLS